VNLETSQLSLGVGRAFPAIGFLRRPPFNPYICFIAIDKSNRGPFHSLFAVRQGTGYQFEPSPSALSFGYNIPLNQLLSSFNPAQLVALALSFEAVKIFL